MNPDEEDELRFELYLQSLEDAAEIQVDERHELPLNLSECWVPSDWDQDEEIPY